jgi:hypothetical protein
LAERRFGGHSDNRLAGFTPLRALPIGEE